jgi:Tfp pilus assembly protein PilN
MSRQINLLVQPRAAPRLSAIRALGGLVVLLVACVAYGAFTWSHTAKIGAQAEQARAQLAAERATRQSLQQKLDARPKAADITAQIDALGPQMAESQEVFTLMRGTQGYANYLRTLARASSEGIWVTAVKIEQAGKTVTVTGRSLRNDAVLRYAENLNQQFGQHGVHFSALDLSPGEKAPGAMVSAPAPIVFRLF